MRQHQQGRACRRHSSPVTRRPLRHQASTSPPPTTKPIMRVKCPNSLTMSWSNLGDGGCEKLADSLRFNNYLVDLDIYSNNITSAGLIRMGLALECVLRCAFACPLHFLCIFIFFALAFSLHLHFYFAHPPIPPLPLRYNTTLRSLNLEWNPVGEAGATILLNSMRLGNTSLTELNVGSCGISLATQRLQRNPCLFPDCPLLIRVFRPECCCRKSRTIAPTWLPRAKRRGSQARLNPSHLYRL